MSEPVYIGATAQTGSKGQLEYTLPFIIMEHVRRIAILSSVELTGGHYDETVLNDGAGVARRYIPATHEAYSNAVETLGTLLSPYFNDTMNDAEAEHLLRLDEAVKGIEIIGATVNKAEYYHERAKVMKRWYRELVTFIKVSGLLDGAAWEEEF